MDSEKEWGTEVSGMVTEANNGLEAVSRQQLRSVKPNTEQWSTVSRKQRTGYRRPSGQTLCSRKRECSVDQQWVPVSTWLN